MMWWIATKLFLSKVPILAWVVGVLVLSNAFTYAEWRHTSAVLAREKTAHALDISNFKATQIAANTQAEAIRDLLIQESKTRATQADANYATLFTKYRASLVRYAAYQGSASQADHNQLPATQGSDGPSTSTELPGTLTITGGDAEICAINTARLQSVHDWAVNLPKQ